jgi:hypothetical protein
MLFISFYLFVWNICMLMLDIDEHLFVDVGFSYALPPMWEDRTHVPMWSQMLTAYSTRSQLHVPWRDASLDANMSKIIWYYWAIYTSNTYFCRWNSRTPTWVNSVIGLHGSWLGHLLWDLFIRRVPFTAFFYPQVINLVFQPY